MTTNHHGDSCDDSATRWNDAETITLHLVVFRQQLQNWFMDHKLAMCPTTTRVSIPLIDRFAVVLVPRKEKEQHDQHAQMTKRLVSAIRLNPLRCFKITRIEKLVAYQKNIRSTTIWRKGPEHLKFEAFNRRITPIYRVPRFPTISMKAASFIWRNLNIFQCFDQLRNPPLCKPSAFSANFPLSKSCPKTPFSNGAVSPVGSRAALRCQKLRPEVA
jgi:hypothetical protein